MKYETKTLSSRDYSKRFPAKARVIKKAVKRGVKEYGETFKKLVSV